MKTITQQQYRKLTRLIAAGRWHIKAAYDAHDAALEITDERDAEGEPELCGHTADAIMFSRPCSVNDLLARCGIKVRKEAQPK